MQWDTFKRLFAFMERLGERKVPVVLNVWGEGDLNAATALGKWTIAPLTRVFFGYALRRLARLL